MQFLSFAKLFTVLIFIALPHYPGQFYVSVQGSDTNSGKIDSPFSTLSKVMSLPSGIFKPGDTVFIRGGVYNFTKTIVIKKNGLPQSLYFIIAYSDERPIFDFSSMPYNSSNRGINLKSNYWHIKGIDIKGAGDNGICITGSNNIVEFCAFYENRDAGLQLDAGASGNTIINCDSYCNADPDNYGDADGFACKMDVGTGNSFTGCRAWLNVDDGWDGYLREVDDVSTTLENCWAFRNGYFKDGNDGGENANGNGFKMGGSDSKLLKHNFKLTRCLAFLNKSHGFDQNSNKGSMILYNCTGYANKGKNFFISKSIAEGKKIVLKNCLELGKRVSISKVAEQLANSWQMEPVAQIADFSSTDTSEYNRAIAPRKADGGLPEIDFMRLRPECKFIDAGVDTGLPFNGNAPDLGCFEFMQSETSDAEKKLEKQINCK